MRRLLSVVGLVALIGSSSDLALAQRARVGVQPPSQLRATQVTNRSLASTLSDLYMLGDGPGGDIYVKVFIAEGPDAQVEKSHGSTSRIYLVWAGSGEAHEWNVYELPPVFGPELVGITGQGDDAVVTFTYGDERRQHRFSATLSYRGIRQTSR